jgi:hypothetical protein
MAGCCVTLHTETTGEWFFTCVRSHMCYQITGSGASFTANLKRNIEVAYLVLTFETYIADVWLVSCMCPEMHFHLAILCKSFFAY